MPYVLKPLMDASEVSSKPTMARPQSRNEKIAAEHDAVRARVLEELRAYLRSSATPAVPEAST